MAAGEQGMRLVRALQRNEEAAILLFCDVLSLLGAFAAIRLIQAMGLAAGG